MGNTHIHTLCYADDAVLIADSEENLQALSDIQYFKIHVKLTEIKFYLFLFLSAKSHGRKQAGFVCKRGSTKEEEWT